MEVFISFRIGVRLNGKDLKEVKERLGKSTIEELNNLVSEDSYMEIACVENTDSGDDLTDEFRNL